MCFSDTPFGIDPFTFVSTAVEDMKVAKQTSTSSTAPFAIPAVPDHAMQDVTAISPLSTPSVEGSGTPKTRGVLNPKVIFPDALLPTLIAKIDQLKSGSMLLVVESTYQALKAQKVKKNAVEAKIRDICEKTGTPKVWTVKADVRVSGLYGSRFELESHHLLRQCTLLQEARFDFGQTCRLIGYLILYFGDNNKAFLACHPMRSAYLIIYPFTTSSYVWGITVQV